MTLRMDTGSKLLVSEKLLPIEEHQELTNECNSYTSHIPECSSHKPGMEKCVTGRTLFTVGGNGKRNNPCGRVRQLLLH